MKRGMGSPNYNAERAQIVRRTGNRVLRERGKSHQWTTDTAQLAGVKGGERAAQVRKAAA